MKQHFLKMSCIFSLSLLAVSGCQMASAGQPAQDSVSYQETAETKESETETKETKVVESETKEKAGAASESVSADEQESVAEHQVLVVYPYTDTIARVKLYEQYGASWVNTWETLGYIGEEGIGTTSDGMDITPEGYFELGPAFGFENPGTKMPFMQITENSYWDGDSNSPTYNTWQEGLGNFDVSVSERLGDYPVEYYYAMVINYNTGSPVPGAGSAFFLHCESEAPTGGCVALPETDMKFLMEYLDSGAHIAIGTSEEDALSMF